MNKVFEDDTATIYHNNYIDIIKELKYDLVIIDPPYNIGHKYKDKSFNDNKSDEEYRALFKPLKNKKVITINYAEETIKYIVPVLEYPSKILTWCYNSNIPRQSRMIAHFNCVPNLKKVIIPYKDPKDKRIAKRIEAGHKGASCYDWFSDINLVKGHTKEKVKGFTNQMPVKLLERLIIMNTEPGDIILDCFFGSGSLYIACKNTGRRCIGIEISKEHLDLAINRIEKDINYLLN